VSTVVCQIYLERIAGYRFGASEITALFCDLREFAFLNDRSRANVWRPAIAVSMPSSGNSTLEGRYR
jgi:hypothetical protein